jgi:signal peptidase I
MDNKETINLEQEQKPTTLKDVVWEIVKFFILAIIIVFPIRIFIAQPFIVNGSSMDPTFSSGQYLIVDELSYRLSEPKRGEVIIFRYPKDPSKFFIKRIIGLPNETVEIKNGIVTIKTKTNQTGFTIKEPYITFTKKDTFTEKLGDGEYFVMGDNRAASYDSRMWGPVPQNFIIGRAFLRLLPIKNVSILPGNHETI